MPPPLPTSLDEVAADTARESAAVAFEDPSVHDHRVYRPLRPVAEVRNADCLELAAELLRERPGRRVVVLSLASERRPGGASTAGAAPRQEESICLRSTLRASLERTGFYPMRVPGTLIFTPNVRVFKDRHYRPLDEPFTVAVATCAGLSRPKLDARNRMSPVDRRETERRIRRIMMACEDHRADAVVLGALGCGTHCNPCEDVAEAFRFVLGERQYVPRVYFAVLENKADGEPIGRVFRAALGPRHDGGRPSGGRGT